MKLNHMSLAAAALVIGAAGGMAVYPRHRNDETEGALTLNPIPRPAEKPYRSTMPTDAQQIAAAQERRNRRNLKRLANRGFQ